jgi:hypothetical protein
MGASGGNLFKPPEPGDRFWKIAGLPVIAVLVLGCCCLAAGINALGLLGDAAGAPLRWLRGGEPEPGLHAVLRDERQAAFRLGAGRLGAGCDYPLAEGTEIRSNPGPGEQFSSELPPEVVEEAARADLGRFTFYAAEGELALDPPAEIDFNLPDSESVALRVSSESTSESGTAVMSMEGTVRGDVYEGEYQRSESLSAVRDGQGIDVQRTLRARFTCPLVWLAP